MPAPDFLRTPRQLSLLPLAHLPLVRPGDDLAALIAAAVDRAGETLRDDDVLVVAQKIVSKAENRYVDLDDVAPSPQALELAAQVNKDPRLVELVLRESRGVLRHRKDVLIVEHRLGFVMANAGIDMSNVEQGAGGGTALLLPRDPDASCESLRQALGRRYGCRIGIVINDSHGRAWRNGTVGVAIGAAGLTALHDRRGDPDLFGRPLLITEVGTADEIAAAGSLVMGQASEGAPVVLMRGLRLNGPHGKAADLIRPRHMDLFR